MQSLASAFIKTLRPRADDDFVDRLNYYYTVILIIVCALIISAKQYVGTPIECWVPPQFTTSMEDYIENYCWIQNTYWLPLNEHIPDDIKAREDQQIGYYQWVPFILLTEALMFCLPCIFWRLANWQSGMNVQQLVNQACEASAMDCEARPRAIRSLAHSIREVLDLQDHQAFSTPFTTPSFRSEPRSQLAAACWRFRCYLGHKIRGCYISTLYLMTKAMYTMNVVAQFFLLNCFLNTEDYRFYGFEILRDLLVGREWHQSGHFPRVTLCDFEVKYVGNLNRYTVQCALIVNFINEKLFILLWWWFALCAAATMSSFCFWFTNLVMSIQRFSFIAKYLSGTSCQSFDRFDDFLLSYLRCDGVFMFRMIANHAGDVVAMEAARLVWQSYTERAAMKLNETVPRPPVAPLPIKDSSPMIRRHVYFEATLTDSQARSGPFRRQESEPVLPHGKAAGAPVFDVNGTKLSPQNKLLD